MAGEPGELYELHLENPDLDDLGTPVLVVALDGYIDAGAGVRLAIDALRTLPSSVVASFDVDELVDYRARRPPLTFERGGFHEYQAPKLQIHRVADEAGTPFLLLTGPEPDVQWERFVAAIGQLVDRFAVRLTVSLLAIPMGVPHTRPTGMTSHANRSGLLPAQPDLFGSMQVPGYATALMEYRFGQQGRDCVGFAAHVPHYLTRTEYPESARALIQATADAAGLLLPTSPLDEPAAVVAAQLASQIAENGEVADVVRALEQQYDSFVKSAESGSLLAQSAPLPTADELGAEFEAFLARQDPPREP
ncbi:PAC2 family protein [Nakamurella leprariae]|uniref:PAC2 family protein n=1 Tax=Nakamurella leprariae TaxID=2803911 RepID=A0A939C0Y6_9ACTN|nr:PAC2 family protein [Nakamurella leprariae]MBM9466539.1 PAC2 family protein [Nakamurella leprariae]